MENKNIGNYAYYTICLKAMDYVNSRYPSASLEEYLVHLKEWTDGIYNAEQRCELEAKPRNISKADYEKYLTSEHQSEPFDKPGKESSKIDVKDVRLIDCDLSLTTLRAVRLKGVITIGQLSERSRTEWTKRVGCELEELLERYGLKFTENPFDDLAG